MDLEGKKEKDLNVIIIQYCPIARDVKGNIKRLELMLSKYTTDNKIDIIILPEMALTGYIFDNEEDIKDFLEHSNEGQTYEFCSNLAKR
jgi:protein N-terminal amidase